jgi:hypothetical protein
VSYPSVRRLSWGVGVLSHSKRFGGNLPAPTWYSSYRNARDRIVYVVCHIVLVAVLIGGTEVIRYLVHLIGNPLFYDKVPIGYIFDTVELGILVPFIILVPLEALGVFRKEEKGDENE